MWRTLTPKAVGSRHLCFESEHSYYGFHVACKVLCICFDQSLFGMPPLIKMLGIRLRSTNNPCKALVLKHDVTDKYCGLFLDIVVIFLDNTDSHLFEAVCMILSLITTCNHLATAAISRMDLWFTIVTFHPNVSYCYHFCCLWEMNMCLTFVSLPQEKKPLLFTIKNCTALYP